MDVKEEKIETPVYNYVDKTETYQDPVYENVAINQTKYYYEIDKWVHKRYITTSGADKNPYWGEVILGVHEREGHHAETYMITCLVDDEYQTYTCSRAIWEQLNKNDVKKVKVTLGMIVEIIE